MKRFPLGTSMLLVFTLAAVVLAGCSTSPMSRIDANRTLYDSWPADMQAAIFEGKVIKDMTPDMVKMSLGKPERIEPRVGSTTSEETWFYEKPDSDGTARSSAASGGGGGGRGRRGGGGGGGGGSRGGRAAAEMQIVFQNGVVTKVN